MSRVGQHDVSPATYRRRRAGVGAAASLVVVLAAELIHGQWSDFRANQSQPACDVTAEAGDTVSGITGELHRAGDGGDNVSVFAHQDGHLRNPNDHRDAARFFVDGSMNLQVGDTMRVMHVGADVCERVGGISISLAAIQASMD